MVQKIPVKIDDIKIAFLGDIFPGGLLHGKENYVSADVLNYLHKFDLRVGTLECALGRNYNDYFESMDEQTRRKNTIYAKDTDINKLKELKIDVVSIANNHVFDLGIQGFKNTIQILQNNDIKYCGSGMNADEASKPAFVNIKGRNIAFLAYCQYFDSSPHPAGDDKPGYNLLDQEKLLNDIRNAKKNSDYLFVLPHWGIEGTYFPPMICKKIAYHMIDSGADGVFGGHSHSIQPQIFYKNKPVFFSLGNFLFADRYVHPPAYTWYPENDNIPVNVPKSTNPNCTTITLKIWEPRLRKGRIAAISISNKMKVSSKYTKLDENHYLNFIRHSEFYDILFWILGIMIKNNYQFFINIRNYLIKLKN